MPIFSYLAYPLKGAKKQLFKDLAALEYCDVTPSDNEEVLILVTDTPDDNQEKELQEKLRSLNFLQSLSMTFGHGDE